MPRQQKQPLNLAVGLSPRDGLPALPPVSEAEANKEDCVQLIPTNEIQGATGSAQHMPLTVTVSSAVSSQTWDSLMLTVCYMHASSYLYDCHSLSPHFYFFFTEFLLLSSTSHFPFLNLQVRHRSPARRMSSTFLPHPTRQHFPKRSRSLCSVPPTGFSSADGGDDGGEEWSVNLHYIIAASLNCDDHVNSLRRPVTPTSIHADFRSVDSAD